MAADPADRIETALARIETAAAAKSYALERALRRHAKLRAHIEDALVSLDALGARERADAE